MLHKLPQEIHHKILKSLPTFQDLHSLVLTHPSLYSAWKSNPNGIKRSIAHTQFQPWPKAHKLLIYQTPNAPSTDIAVLPNESLRRLIANARYIDKREAAFFDEDRCPVKRCLTYAERYRYRRAMYRIWRQLLMTGSDFFGLPLVELLELKEVSTRLWGSGSEGPAGLSGEWRVQWRGLTSACMMGRMEGLRGHSEEEKVMGMLRCLGGVSDVHTVSVVLEEGQGDAGELERVEREWLSGSGGGVRAMRGLGILFSWMLLLFG